MPSPEAPVGNVQAHITIRAVGSGVLPTDLPQMPMAHLMLSGTLVTRVPLLLQSPLLQQVGALLLGCSWSWLCTQSTPEGLGWATPNTLWVSCPRHDGWLRSWWLLGRKDKIGRSSFTITWTCESLGSSLPSDHQSQHLSCTCNWFTLMDSPHSLKLYG